MLLPLDFIMQYLLLFPSWVTPWNELVFQNSGLCGINGDPGSFILYRAQDFSVCVLYRCAELD